jgi:hypothetical protein
MPAQFYLTFEIRALVSLVLHQKVLTVIIRQCSTPLIEIDCTLKSLGEAIEMQ